ncbi:MAG: pyrroline-5-carboxylate reductase [Planctomycetaceae bacterium]|nr:pyrroline-5-carboxylate reductase [Planctomycetaceae bacterium]
MNKILEKSIGFLGAGQMASALGAGFVRAGVVKSSNVYAYDVSTEALKKFSQNVGGTACGTLEELVQKSDIIFLAVKPQHIHTVLGSLKELEKTSKLFVSIAAGVTMKELTGKLGEQALVVRVMPNTPCLIGSGASGLCASDYVCDVKIQMVQTLLETVGIAVEVPERLMNAVTGLSGSGPAFGYVMIEAMSDAGVKLGLPRDTATRLAAQTLKGAAEMVLQTGEHPGVLRDRVASPGGTTIAGLVALEEAGLRSALIAAVCAAAERADELG